MTFGDWLLQTLEIRGWTQSELARRSRITRAQVSRIISGERRPGVDALSGMARALGLSVDDLLRRLDDLPGQGVRDSRRIVYEVNGDELVLGLWRALAPADQSLVRDLMERLTVTPPKIIGGE